MADFDKMKMGKRIRELRSAAKLSQIELANLVGVVQHSISQYESGTVKPSLEVLVKLAVTLETSSDYLLGLEN